MALDTVKCASCNIVINELLAFIQNKADVMDEVSLTQICCESFGDSDIAAAKKLLFDAVPNSKRKLRKCKGKNLRDIDDIICLLKLTDPEVVPIFVARDLQKLPPISFDHVDATKLLKDILILQSDIKVLKSNYVTTTQLSELKNEIEYLKSASVAYNNYDFINRKRGAFMANLENFDSGPMALQQQLNSESKDTSPKSMSHLKNSSIHCFENVGTQKSFISTPENTVTDDAGRSGHTHATENIRACNIVSLAQPDASNESESVFVGLTSEQCKTPTTRSSLMNSNVDTNHSVEFQSNKCKSIAEVLKASNECKQIVGEKWNVVSRKKRNKPLSSGQRGKAYVGPEGKFKAADIKVPLFISYVSKNTDERDIIQYIKDSAQEDVTLFKINRKTEKSYNSFKLYVPTRKLDLFLSTNFWPDGITFRRFMNETYRRKTGISEQTSLKQ